MAHNSVVDQAHRSVHHVREPARAGQSVAVFDQARLRLRAAAVEKAAQIRYETGPQRGRVLERLVRQALKKSFVLIMRDGGRDHGHRPGMLLRLWRSYHTCYIQGLGWASASGRRKVPSDRIGFRGRAKLIPSVGIICM